MPQYAGFHSEKLVNIVQARLSAVRQIRPRLARGVVPVHNGLNADIEPGPKSAKGGSTGLDNYTSV
jgi:hypothetical protein